MVKRFLKERLGTIILFIIVIIFVLWGYLSIQKARDNAITYNEDYVAPEGNVNFDDPGKYVSIAKTDKLELFYNEAKGAIQVKNLENGYLWKGICDNEVYDLDNINAQWSAYLQSPLTISYNDLKRRDSGVQTLYAGRDCNLLEYELIDDGVAVSYGFTTPGIYVTVEYVLEDDQLVVRIPYEKIREESRYALSTIELLPYFGAAGNENEGYLFYPDGSGAITPFEKANTRPSNVKLANFYTYTNRVITFMNLFYADSYERYTAALPVYGIKNGNNALFGVFTQGEENSGISIYPSGYVVNLNHAGFLVYTRNTYTVDMYSMSTGVGASTTGGSKIQRVDKLLIPEDREVRYFFLSGEDADYSGMAQVYREYLIENGMLNDAIENGDQIPLALRLLMGTTKEGMVFDEYIPMTDFDQAQEIIGRLQDQGVGSMEVVLNAWMKGYEEYEYWGPARQLGGTSGLKDLNAYVKGLSNVDVYLESGFMFASSKTSGLDESNDVVYDGLNIEVSMEDMDGTIYYLVNPLAAYNRNSKFLSKLKKYDSFGVAYDDVGKYAFPDFNTNAAYTKSGTVDQLQQLMASTKESNRKVGTAGANQYVYTYADYLYELRERNYGLNITDYAIPFILMVLSGRVPYSTDGAGNLSYDLQTQKLKWIEYGAIPYFYLTYESALNLRGTNYDALFSSNYNDWEATVVDTYNEFKTNLSDVYGQQIIEHKIITDDLKRLEYANGIVVYINYGDTEAAAEGVTVPAKDYVVVRGGGQ